jgi:hypothetical protein
MDKVRKSSIFVNSVGFRSFLGLKAPVYFLRLCQFIHCNRSRVPTVLKCLIYGNAQALSGYQGRAITQTVSRWLPTAAARVRSLIWSGGICGGQSGAGAGFLRVLRFPLTIFIPPIAPQSPSPIIWGWYNRPEVAAVQGT